MLMVFSICGLIGGILCAVGDILFDFKGGGNEKLGSSKMIDSNWLKMSDRRFGLSMVFAFFGDFGICLGIISLAEQIKPQSPILATATYFCGIAGSIGGFFIHTFLCIQPLVYKGIMSDNNFTLADSTLERIYKQTIPPFIITYITLMLPSIFVIIAVLRGFLSVPVWSVCLNPIAFLIIGNVFRLIDKKTFADLPGICMPSLGLGALGAVGIIALL